MTAEVQARVTQSRTVSITEAGQILGIGKSKAYELARTGQFPVRLLALGRQKRVSIQQLEAYLAGDES